MERTEIKYHQFRIKDPGSALTHLFGMYAAIVLSPILLIHASNAGASFGNLTSLAVFTISMIFMYSASTAYHTFILPRNRELILKRVDHMMIPILIAGSYTPICVNVLNSKMGDILLVIVWAIAVAEVIFKLFWVTCPKWISTVIYLVMGWSCLLVMPELVRTMPVSSFILLLVGGIAYSVGGIIYALKLKALNNLWPNFGSHEIFHVCVLIGNFFHYLVMYQYVAYL